jgi:hypothetical protein
MCPYFTIPIEQSRSGREPDNSVVSCGIALIPEGVCHTYVRSICCILLECSDSMYLATPLRPWLNWNFDSFEWILCFSSRMGLRLGMCTASFVHVRDMWIDCQAINFCALASCMWQKSHTAFQWDSYCKTQLTYASPYLATALRALRLLIWELEEKCSTCAVQYWGDYQLKTTVQ